MNSNPIDIQTKEDLARAIEACGIQCFSDIPAHLVDEDTASSWLEAFPPWSGHYIDELYDQVPQKWRNDKFLRVAAKVGCRVLKGLDPEKTPIYRELIEICSVDNSGAFRDIAPSFRNKEGIEFLLSEYIFRLDSLFKDAPWVLAALSDNVILELVSQSMDMSSCDDVVTLRHVARLDVAAKRFATGAWLDLYPMKTVARPESLMDCISQLNGMDMTDEDSFDEESVLMGFAMSHPIDQLVPLMTTRRLQKLLFEMYSTEALAPYLKKSRALRGILLEESLGL
jgi:hypothetical protein